MKRLIFVSLAFLVGCSGAGSAGSRFLPVTPNAGGGALESASVATVHTPSGVNSVHRGHKVRVRVTLTVPRRHRGGRMTEAHPATISPLTQSVSFAINGGAAQVFNVTPSSPGCSTGASGTTCTFSVSAPVGSDSFVVSTFNAAGGGGAMLDRGVATIVITAGKNNTPPPITLGPVASSTADSGVGSLRYAIGAANPGDTIMFAGLAAGSLITLASPITITNSVNIAGPGVTASVRRADARRPDTTYSGITISGGGLVQIFVIKPGATVTIGGLILTQGNATTSDQPGGAVYSAGTLTLANDAFVSNTSAVDSPYVRKAARKRHPLPHHGPVRTAALHAHCVGTTTYAGAVYNHGLLTVTGSTFDSNVAPSNSACSLYGYGGAIYNDEYGTLTSSSNTYVNNAAEYGGAVDNDSSYGTASFTGDTFNANLGCTAATGCPTTGCVPDSTCSEYAYGEGAGVYDDEGPGVTVSGCTFTNNVDGGNTPESEGYGAALTLYAGSPSVTGSTFTANVVGGGTSNYSEGYGGAIYVDASGTLQLSNDTFTSNAASSDYYSEGGAIYYDTPISGSTDSFVTNTASATGSLAADEPEAYGGALYSDGGTTSLSATTFSGNAAAGAYVAYGGAAYFDGATRLTGDTFTSNSAIASGITDEYDYAYGGAVYDDSGFFTVSGTTFTSNMAEIEGSYDYYAEGGAVYNDGGGMSSTGDTFTSNSVVANGSYSYPELYGGAIESSESLTSSGDTFKSNSLSGLYYNYGGAVYSDDTFTANNDTFTGNSSSGASYSYGGALLLYSTTNISNTTFTGNSNTGAFTYGGAIYADGTGVTLGGVTISNNTSTYYGGGIYDDSSTGIANSTITGNSVTGGGYEGGGGGIFVGSGTTVVENSTVSGNSANVTGFYAGGGGVYNYGGGLIDVESTIAANGVTGSSGLQAVGGGGILNYDETAIINSTITGNASAFDGGGLLNFCHCGPVEIINATLQANSATGSGGNIDNESVSSSLAEMDVVNSIAGGGSAATGPDVNNTGILSSGDYNIIQTAVAGTALAGVTTHNLMANPGLLALANNGGPTQTMADTATSPGTAYIPFSGSTCGAFTVPTDQRGFARGAGGKCDVGAYEFSGVGSAIKTRLPVELHPIKRAMAHPTVHGQAHPAMLTRKPHPAQPR